MLFSGPYKKAIRIEGERSQAFTLARGRLALIVAFFILAYTFLAARAFDLAVIQSGAYKAPFEVADYEVSLSERPQLQNATANTSRGQIYDRNGVLVATTLPMFSLYADPSLVADPEGLAKDLMRIFPDQSGAGLLEKLESEGRFVWIERNISPRQQRLVLELGEPGLAFEKGAARFYPHGNLLAHMVGYTNVDQSGLSGVERGLNEKLHDGEDATLSIDVRLQHILHREVFRAIEEFTAKAGAGVILDAHTGEVLAGVSLPDFNPHEPGNVDPQKIFNRLTLGVYELGSIFKIFSTAALLENFDLEMDYTFDAREPLRAGRFTINDYHAEDRILTIPEVFMYSSNIGSALMGQMVGTEKLKGFYADLGLLDPLSVEIREIGAPLVPNPWREVSTLTASYGHGLATTPLQMAAAVATIVNGGYKVSPTLLAAPRQGDVAMAQDNIKQRIITPQTSQKMRELLRLTVAEGTGANADVPGLQVGGKTGTAEKFSASGGYDRSRLISSFVGVFPSADPDYVVMVMVDEPKGNKRSFGYATAGWVAAPATARIISAMANVLGIAPAEPPEKDNMQAFAAGLKQFISVKEKP